MEPQTPACPGDHEPPPHLTQVFPPLADRPHLGKVLTAAWHECTPCMNRQRGIAVEHPELIEGLVALWLMWMAITADAMGKPTTDTASDLLDGFLPPDAPQPTDTTRAVLISTTLKQVPGPLDRPVNTWSHAQITSLIGAMFHDGRALVWVDSLSFLTGVLRGEGRAMAESN